MKRCVMVFAVFCAAVMMLAQSASARPATAGAGRISASAAAADACNGELCMYENSGFGGLVFHLRTFDSTFANNACSGCRSSRHSGSNGTWSDQASSVLNISSSDYCMYKDTGYHTEILRLHPGDGISFGASDPRNDEISSGKNC